MKPNDRFFKSIIIKAMGKKNRAVWANARLERQSIEWMDLPYFKITFEVNDKKETQRFRVVPAGRFNWKILESLQKIYMDNWMSKIEATRNAVKVINDFYTAADRCSKEWEKPFKVYVTKTFNNNQ